jgi:hypothetical protein
MTERDLVFQMPSLPQVLDDACLGLILQIGGAMTTGQSVNGKLVFNWGG